MEGSEHQLISRVENPQLSPGLLLVFGQGPVIDKETRLKASDVQTSQGGEDVNFWSKNMVDAASVLVNRGAAEQIVVMGGRTGGQKFAPEAELISEKMIEKGISPDIIVQEKESLDTIENLVNFLNLFDEKKIDTAEIDVLCSSFHVTRLRVLLKLFRVPIRHVFAAEEVMRFAARSSENTLDTDSSGWSNSTLSLIEKELDTNKKSDFYAQQKGLEKRDIVDRRLTEDALIRELLIYPEKWLPVTAALKSDTRLREVVQQAEELYPGMCKNKFGIDVEGNIDKIREGLTSVVYTPIPPIEFEQWKKDTLEGKPWPEDITQKFEMLGGFSSDLQIVNDIL